MNLKSVRFLLPSYSEVVSPQRYCVMWYGVRFLSGYGEFCYIYSRSTVDKKVLNEIVRLVEFRPLWVMLRWLYEKKIIIHASKLKFLRSTCFRYSSLFVQRITTTWFTDSMGHILQEFSAVLWFCVMLVRTQKWSV